MKIISENDVDENYAAVIRHIAFLLIISHLSEIFRSLYDDIQNIIIMMPFPFSLSLFCCLLARNRNCLLLG